MAPGPSRRGTGKSRTKSTSQLPSVRDKHQNTEGIEQKVDKDHQKEDNLKMSKLNMIREQLKICDRKHIALKKEYNEAKINHDIKLEEVEKSFKEGKEILVRMEGQKETLKNMEKEIELIQKYVINDQSCLLVTRFYDQKKEFENDYQRAKKIHASNKQTFLDLKDRLTNNLNKLGKNLEESEIQSKYLQMEKDSLVKTMEKIICWSCHAREGKGVKLIKCSGCKKAMYCGQRCKDADWERHGGYCEAKQEKRRRRRMEEVD